MSGSQAAEPEAARHGPDVADTVPMERRPLELRVIEPRAPGVVERLRELWHARRLIRYFGKRALEKRYKRTILGWIWLPLRPVIEIASQALVFGGLLAVGTGSDVPYLVFFIVGATAWHLFADSAIWSTRSLELQRGLLRRTYVPRLTVLLGPLSIPLVQTLVYVAILLLIIVYYVATEGAFHLTVGVETLLAGAGAALLLLLGLGVGLWLAIPATKARDVRFSLVYVISFLYFVTPVIYPLSRVPESYQPIAALNPVAAPVEMVKAGLIGTELPTTTAVVVSVSAVTLIWLGGLRIFARHEAVMADTV
jgi:lipopolysaccharide transport system permease protein